jgi:hypothetical protein
MKSTILILAASALLFPVQAMAACGTVSGPYSVSCEQGVQIYRHNTKSVSPRTSRSDFNQREALEVSRQQALINTQLESRRINIEEREQLALERDLIRRRTRTLVGSRFSAYRGYGFNRFGYGYNRTELRAQAKRRYIRD